MLRQKGSGGKLLITRRKLIEQEEYLYAEESVKRNRRLAQGGEKKPLAQKGPRKGVCSLRRGRRRYWGRIRKKCEGLPFRDRQSKIKSTWRGGTTSEKEEERRIWEAKKAFAREHYRKRRSGRGKAISLFSILKGKRPVMAQNRSLRS